MKERRIGVEKDEVLDRIGLIDNKTGKIFILPEDDLDDILEDIKNLR